MLGKPDCQETFIDRVQAVGIEPWFNVAALATWRVVLSVWEMWPSKVRS